MQRTFRRAHLAALLTGGALALTVVATPRLAHAQGASIQSANDEQKAAAQQAFEEGMKAQKAGKKEEALQKFKDSYNAVASPNSHLMVARTLVDLGRFEEAYVEYDKTIAEAEEAATFDPKYQGAAQSGKTEQSDLRAKIGLLRLNVTGTQSGDRVTVRGREIPQSDWSKPIPVMPGTVRIELQQTSGKETVKEVEATAGGEHMVELSPQAGSGATAAGSAEGSAKLDTGSGGKPDLRTWAYVAGGVGVAGVATFAIFGAMSNSKHSKLEDSCTNGVCPSDLKDDRDAGKRYQTIANIGLVVGVVGLGAGTALYLMSGKSEKTAVHRPKSGPRVNDVSVGYRSVLVSGSF